MLQAAVAVQAGVCVDIFAVTNEYTDLASLKFLSIESGGSIFFYSNTDDSTLPQDMWVSNEIGFNVGVMSFKKALHGQPR